MKYAIGNPNESANHVNGRKKKGVAYDTGYGLLPTIQAAWKLCSGCFL